MIRCVLFILLATAWIYHHCAAAEPRQPNIILIMADDFGYECVGANGCESYQTPNLDKLATGGMRFENCYVQPVCTPTRVQLMTGMYNVRNYIRFGLLDPNATTFADPFKAAGYATAVVGKWQLGREKDSPRRFGFDESFLWNHTRRPPRYANPGLELNGEEQNFTNGEYGPKVMNDFALDFITRHKEQPFFLYYPMMLTHGPYPPTPDSDDWDPQARQDHDGDAPKHFADMVAYMDKMVGQLVARLDELGIRDDTLILFTGDNGTGRGTTTQFKGQPYPGGKGGTNARGMHVPLIANWPGHVPAARVNDDLIDSTDFFPTVCAAAGVEVPKSLTIDGHSFWRQLKGENGKPREWLYTWYASDGGPRARFEFARSKTLKLYRDGRVFDLRSDPFEEHALSVDDFHGADANDLNKLQSAIDQYADARPAHLLASKEVKKNKAGGNKGQRKKAAKRRANRQQQSAAQ
jgi:arylsulfatase A